MARKLTGPERLRSLEINKPRLNGKTGAERLREIIVADKAPTVGGGGAGKQTAVPESTMQTPETASALRSAITRKEKDYQSAMGELWRLSDRKARTGVRGKENADRHAQVLETVMAASRELSGMRDELRAKEAAPDYVASSFSRWLELAGTAREMTDVEKAEAKAGYKALTDEAAALRRDGKTQAAQNYEAVAAVLGNKTRPGAAFMAGVIDAFPFMRKLTDKAVSLAADEGAYRDAGYSAETTRMLVQNNPIFDAEHADRGSYIAGAGSTNLSLLLGGNGLAKGVTSGIKWLSGMPRWAQAAINSGLTFGTMGMLETADDGPQTGEDGWDFSLRVLKTGGIQALGGALGSAAGSGVGSEGLKFLTKAGLVDNILARAAVAGFSGAAFAGGNEGVQQLSAYLGNPNGYKPDGEQIAKDMTVAFAFGAVMSLLQSAARGAANPPQQDPNRRPDSLYFKDIQNLEELNRARRALAHQFHPDLGGSEEVMARINAEYDALKNWFLQQTVNEAAAAYQRQNGSGTDAAAARETVRRDTALIINAVRSGDIVGADAQNAAQILAAVIDGGAAEQSGGDITAVNDGEQPAPPEPALSEGALRPLDKPGATEAVIPLDALDDGMAPETPGSAQPRLEALIAQEEAGKPSSALPVNGNGEAERAEQSPVPTETVPETDAEKRLNDLIVQEEAPDYTLKLPGLEPEQGGMPDAGQESGADRNGGDGGRIYRESAGEQAGGLEKSAGGARERAADTRRTAFERQNRVNDLRLEKVSTRSLGIAQGTDSPVITIMPEEIWDDELREVAQKIREGTGKEVRYFTGMLQLRSTDGIAGARGARTPSGIFVQADNLRFTASQIAAHESFHDLAADDLGLVEDVRESILQRYSEDELNGIVETYLMKYRGIYDPSETEAIMEEVFADAYAGMNAFGAGATRYTETVRETTERRGGGMEVRQTQGPRGPPERYSFGRVRDTAIIAQAEDMEKSGESAESIWNTLGVARTMDGHGWRSEIDDSGMTFSRGGDALLEQDEPEYRRYKSLINKLIVGTVSDAEHEELVALDQKWGGARAVAGHDLNNYGGNLEDIIRHDALFKEYPFLRNTGVRFGDLPGSELGRYGAASNVITLDNSLRGKPESTLVHEIQHAIQAADGLPGGSNPEYWKNAGFAGRYEKSKETLKRYEEHTGISKERARLFEQLQSGEITGTQMQDRLDAFIAALPGYGKENYDTLKKEQEQAYKLRGDARSELALYESTAGEIEARDTSARRMMTAEQRRVTPPQTADEKTVFADGMFSLAESGDNEGKVYNNTVVLKPETIDKYLKDYASKTSPNYAQAYITYICPEDFLQLTTSRQGRDVVERSSHRLNIEELSESTRHQPFYLTIDHETGEILGHEGRHRAAALNDAGVKKMPVLLFDYGNKTSKSVIPKLTLSGQDFGSSRSYAVKDVFDVTPFNYANRDAIILKYATQPKTEAIGEKHAWRQTVRYSLEDSKGNALTREQAEYFKDSKARDKDGNLRVFYHGTNRGDFTVFDKKKLGSSNDLGWYGCGFYFAYTEGEASFYGNRVIPAYLDIKKPWVFENELAKYDGQDTSIIGDTAAFAINLSDKFPDLASALTVRMTKKYACDGKKAQFENLDMNQYAARVRKLYESDKLRITQVYDRDNVYYEYTDGKGFYTHWRFSSEEQARKSRLDVVARYMNECTYLDADIHMPEKYMQYIGGRLTEKLRAQGYDGILQSDYGDEAVVFESNQIKRIDNKNPTENPDIRYSVADDDENALGALRSERDELTDGVMYNRYGEPAFMDAAGRKKLNNNLARTDADIDKIVDREHRAAVKTSLRDILDSLSIYRRSDLESLAEQISGGAWDDYEDLTRGELESALRETVTERMQDLTPEEQGQAKYGLFVRPPETGGKMIAFPDIRYSAENDLLTGDRDETYTNDGKSVPFVYAVLPAESLVISNDQCGNINPEYPRELQPRDRSRVSSQEQIIKMSRTLNPRLLTDSPTAQNGAPIIRADGVVVSGNGRAQAVRSAYEYGTAEEYERYIRENGVRYGIKGELPEHPVLVRVAENEDWKALSQKLNESATASYSATENAMTDASKLGDVLELFVPNDEGIINTADNRDFIGQFIARVVPESERGNMTTADGMLSQAGLDRAKNAVFAAAYKDGSLQARMSEYLDDETRNVTRALLNTAPHALQIRSGIENGTLHDLNLADDVAQAAKLYTEVRAAGATMDEYLAQMTLQDDYSKESKMVALFIETNKRSGKAITEFLNEAYSAIESAGDPNQLNLLGGNDDEHYTKADILAAAGKKFLDNGGGQTRRIGFVLDTDGRMEADMSGSEPGSGGAPAPQNAGEGAEQEPLKTELKLPVPAAETMATGDRNEPDGKLKLPGGEQKPAPEKPKTAAAQKQAKAEPERKPGFTGRILSDEPQPQSDDACKSFSDYAKNVQARAEAEKAERLRMVPKEEFRGTPAMEKLGIRIEGSVADYWGTQSLLDNARAAEDMRKAIRKMEMKLRATAAEKEFASGIAAGVYTEEDIPKTMDGEVVRELADLYFADRAMGYDRIMERRIDINRRLDEKMETLLKDSDNYKPLSSLILNHRTTPRLLRDMYGDEQGTRVYNELFSPVTVNNAEKYRFQRRMLDQARTFTDSNGKKTPLNREERAIVQQMIEGRAVAEAVAGMEMKEAIISAAENIRKGGALEDQIREFSLNSEMRKLTEQYARWLETLDALESGRVDAVKTKNAEQTFKRIFNDFYEAINDFLVVHGYEPIGFIRGYAPHLQPEEARSLLNRALQMMGVNTDVTKLPASIAGLTSEFKPNKRWNPYFLQRTGDVTQYDISAAFESYVDYMSDVFYHTDDIMRVRRAANYFRKTYAPENIRNDLERADGLRDQSTEEKAAFLRQRNVIQNSSALTPNDIEARMQEYVTELYESVQKTTKYGDFVTWLDNYANILAGKQSLEDRGMEYGVGRRTLNIGNRLTRAFGKANVAGNLSSALNQSAQLSQILAENRSVDLIRALADIGGGKLRRENFWNESDFLIGKKGVEPLVQTTEELILDKLFSPIELMDSIVAALAVRTRYNREISGGKSHRDAMRAADRYGAEIMGSRMRGERPLGFESKKPINQMAHIFQLEALNAWEHVRKDLPKEFRDTERRYGRKKAAWGMAKILLKGLFAAFILNRISEKVYGGTPAPFDLMGLTCNFFASGEGMGTNAWLAYITDNGLEKLGAGRIFGTERGQAGKDRDWSRAWLDLGYNITNDVPFVRNIAGLLGLGDETLPWPDLYGAGKDLFKAVQNSGVLSLETAEGVGNLMTQLIPGGRQLSKTYQGIKTMAQGGRFKGYGDKQRLQYPTGSTFQNWIQASLFGNQALSETRDFYASGDGGLSVHQTQLWKDLTGGGADGQEVYDVIQCFRAVGNDAGLSSYERGKQQRDAITQAALTDWQKLSLYRGLTGAESRGEKFLHLLDGGMSWTEVMDAYDRYAMLDADESATAGEKATDFAAWVDGQDYSPKQQALIKENLSFYNIIPAEAKRYEQLANAGLDTDDARDLTLKLAGLEPEEEGDAVSALQRYSAITESDLSDDEQLAALSAVMGDAELHKVKTGYQFGVSPGAYVEAKKAVALIDENNSITQDEATRAISGMLLPDTQKAVLWQLQNKSWKADNNPFSVTVGNQVRASLQAGGDGVTASGGLQPINSTGRLTLPTP